jgi:hypothetical protein
MKYLFTWSAGAGESLFEPGLPANGAGLLANSSGLLSIPSGMLANEDFCPRAGIGLRVVPLVWPLTGTV